MTAKTKKAVRAAAAIPMPKVLKGQPEKAIDLSDVPEVDMSNATRGKSRHANKRLVLPLAGVRAAVGKTQVDVSRAGGIDQGDVSRLERRDLDEVQLGTLRKYLKAMGVELELVAIAGPARIVINPEGR